ncbi:hypothetical protein C0992_006094 [Termitomyces sp. T32_za158]|nr:hypothetical protein C0992_006094 [Termitomyces sp. T32_za158]
MSSYQGPDDSSGHPATSYRNFVLGTYVSLIDADATRIIRVTGWKMQDTASQHEYILATITRNGREGYVVFERSPGERDSSVSISAGSSTASFTSSLKSSSRFKAKDMVNFYVSDHPADAEQIWKIEFGAPPPLYMAINIASTIFDCFPTYVLSKTNCYFYVHVFQSMLLTHCSDSMPQLTDGDTLAGYTLGLKLWDPPLTPEEVDQMVSAKFDEELQDFRKSLETKAALVQRREEVVRQEQDEKHRVEHEKDRMEIERERRAREESDRAREESDRAREEVERKLESESRAREESDRAREKSDREIEKLKEMLAAFTTAQAQSCE